MAAKLTHERLPIIAGPSKWDWTLSLMDGNGEHRRSISFDVRTFTVHAIINMICREDNSGENWLFEGVYKVDGSRVEVRGYYSTQNRTGWISLK